MDTARMKYYTKDDGFLEAVTSKLDFVGNAFNAFLCPAPLGILANGKNVSVQRQLLTDYIKHQKKLQKKSLKKIPENMKHPTLHCILEDDNQGQIQDFFEEPAEFQKIWNFCVDFFFYVD